MLKNIRLYAVSITLLFAFVITVSAGEKGNDDPLLSRTIILKQYCHKFELWGNVEIILSPVYSDRIVLQGHSTDVNSIEVKQKNEKLIVHAQLVKHETATKIIVPAAMLHLIRINGNSIVSSSGYLKVPALKVELNGEMQVDIQSTGKVTVEATDEYTVSAK